MSKIQGELHMRSYQRIFRELQEDGYTCGNCQHAKRDSSLFGERKEQVICPLGMGAYKHKDDFCKSFLDNRPNSLDYFQKNK